MLNTGQLFVQTLCPCWHLHSGIHPSLRFFLRIPLEALRICLIWVLLVYGKMAQHSSRNFFVFPQTWKVSLIVASSSFQSMIGLLISGILFGSLSALSLDFNGLHSLAELLHALELPHLGLWSSTNTVWTRPIIASSALASHRSTAWARPVVGSSATSTAWARFVSARSTVCTRRTFATFWNWSEDSVQPDGISTP